MFLETFLSVYFFTIIEATSQCQVCPVNCNPVVYYYSTDATICGQLNQSIFISNFEKPDVNCYGYVHPMICAGFQKVSDFNFQNNCTGPGGQMCSSWCDQMSACLTAPVLNCSDPTQFAQPGSSCVNVTMADVIIIPTNYTPTYLPYCPTVTSEETNSQLVLGQELGPLASIYQDPGFPPIPLVFLPHESFADIFEPKCSAFHGSVQRPKMAGFFIFFVIFGTITTALFVWRRHYWPIRAREPFLLATFVFFNFVLYLMFSEYEIYGTTAQCDILYVASAIGGPLYYSPLILRSLRLVFFYQWNLSKVKNHAKDWYFDHRWLVSMQNSAIILLINAIVCSCMAIMVMVVNREEAHGTVLATGRCYWWYFSPEIVNYVQTTYNLTLQDSLLNMYGIGPYSVHFSSCEFCRLRDAFVDFILIWNLVYVCILVWCTYILRNINDQYWLWREFMLSCIANIFLFPLVIAAVTPQGANAFGVYKGGETDFIGVVVSIVVLWNQICVIVLPLCLTFTRTANAKAKFGQHEVSTKSQTSPFYSVQPKAPDAEKTRCSFLEVDKDGIIRVSADVDDVLSDPVGEQCLRNFAIELFKAELVEFYIQAKAYHKMHDKEQMRVMASKLYYTYLAEGSPLQINISHKTREKYDRLANDGVFDESQMVEVPEEAHVFTGYRKKASTVSSKNDSSHLKPSRSEDKTHENEKSLDNSTPSVSTAIRDVSEPISPTTVTRLLTDEKQSGIENKSIENKSIENKSIENKSFCDESSQRFQAVDFHQPIKEVRNLLRDDWLRFQQSKHWETFRDHLVKTSQMHDTPTDFDERRHSTYIPELSVTDADSPNGEPKTPRKTTNDRVPSTPRTERVPTTPRTPNPDAA